jgi:hypothetical protein
MKQRITTLFASGVLALALFGVARAGPFEDAQAAANGHGVPQDYVRAHMWFNIAAASDVSVRDAVKWRDLVATRMTPAQIAEAQRLAREWKPK